MQNPGDITPKDGNEAAVLDFYTLLLKKDFDRWGELFTEDARQENPYMPALEGLDSEFVGRDRLVFHYKTALRARKGHEFIIHALHRTGDPDCIIVEAGGRSEVAETGRIYDQRYVTIFRLREGRIAAMREYFNPLVFQKAFDGFLVGDDAVPN